MHLGPPCARPPTPSHGLAGHPRRGARPAVRARLRLRARAPSSPSSRSSRFFPITVKLLYGLRASSASRLGLMRSSAPPAGAGCASVELPAAPPNVVQRAARSRRPASVIGAVFGEWAGARGRPRPPRPARQQAAPDPARLRVRCAADAHRRGAVRPRLAAERLPRARGTAPGEPRPRRSAGGDPRALSGRARPPAARRRTVPPRRRGEPFELMLDYFPNADHAGIYAAQAGEASSSARAWT